MVGLRIYGFINTPRNLLVGLKKTIDAQYPSLFAPVSVHPDLLPLPEEGYDSHRRQYLASSFLSVLDGFVPPTLHGLALVNLDLFVPRLNFIFGLAQPGGNALVALPRLQPAFYQLPSDKALYFRRIVIEVVHELGHVLGLGHCDNYCVMRFSNTLADTDRKPAKYCETCFQKLVH
ncbi:MAG: archaemetzincin family Zn-dependent metalloprotease [Promethearchaeota archaeon]